MRRIPELDALRAVAAALVFVHHVQLPGLEAPTKGLDVGVMLFFSLSGFLLYAPFAKARETGGSVRTTPYVIRRLFRIYPAYLAAVVGGALLYGWRPESIVAIFTMRDSPILVAWTLWIEVVFYLALPVIALVLARSPAAHRLRLLVALAVISLALGTLDLALNRVLPIGAPAWLFAFVPGMILGDLYARGHPFVGALGQRRWLAAGVALLIVSAIPNIAYPDIPGAVGSGLLVAWCVARERLGATGGRVAEVAAALSYGVYLWHLPVIDALNRPGTWSGAMVSALATIAIASVTYIAIEAPGIRLGQVLARGADSRQVRIQARAQS